MNSTRESPERLLYTVAEAAAMCGISRSHFYGLLQRGEVPSVAIGRSRRIPVGWLTAWIAGQVEEWEKADEGRSEAGRR